MAQAISTQNQNVQLTKTFIIAFGAVLLAIPIVSVITASIVQAQFAGLVSAHAAPAQSNSVNTCEMPADEKAAVVEAQKGAQANKAGWVSFKWLPWVSQSNSYSESHVNNTTNTSTVTTDNSKVIIKDNGNTDNRWSGNTLINDSFNKKTIIKDNGNTLNLLSGNTVNTDNSNTSTNNTTTNTTTTTNTNTNSGNTAVNSGNVAVNSGNTVTTDNDVVDVL